MNDEVVYRGKKFLVALDEMALPDGRTLKREKVIHPGAVAILPLIDADHLCLLRNRRYAVGEVLWEIPAGTLEPNEPPEQTAIRELAEETGYQAGRWRKLHEFYPSPGFLGERMHLFLAQDLSPGSQQLQVGEDIEPQVVSWQQALAWALDGTIRDAKTLIALLLWEKVGRQ